MKTLFGSNRIETKKVTSLGSKKSNHASKSKLIKSKFKSWFLKKQNRFLALYETSTYILRTKGKLTFAHHLYRFFKGERLNISSNTVFQSAQITDQTKSQIESYQQWIQENFLDENAIRQQQAHELTLSYRPLISILTPVSNTNADVLEKMIGSVLAQTYSNWEFCLVDSSSTNSYIRLILDRYLQRDKRIKVKYLNENLGITGNLNQALAMASGEFIALLDQNDELSVNALYENILLLNQNPNAEVIYSDEDKINLQGMRCDPCFKPKWSPDSFYSAIYNCHLGVYKKKSVDKINGFREGFDGAQDYDLVLRLIEQTNEIYHIPKVLYHWRQARGLESPDLNYTDYVRSAQLKAVSEHFQRTGIDAEVTYGLAPNLLRVKRKLKEHPKVSIIIPTRDQHDLLKCCIDSIKRKTTYDNYEIVVVNNCSSEPATLEYLKSISKEIKIIEYNKPFNFAAINNFAASRVEGSILLFLNNDTEIISSEWLESMIEHAVRPEVGAVGARLLYPDGKIQHAGVITGIGGVAGHAQKNFDQDHPGYFSRAKAIQNLSAVTGACMMVRKDVFELLGGFDEKNLATAFNDIDFCLRIRERKMLIIYTPYAELYHHESASRGYNRTIQKIRQFHRESKYMITKWGATLNKDPYYNVNLTLLEEDFSINLPTKNK